MKPALSFEEQLNLLIERGLKCSDRENALDILSRVNYYKLSGYSLHFREKDIFQDGIFFEDIYALYVFDKRISSMLMDLIETVEVSIKTKIAYYIAREISPIGHWDFDAFDDAERHVIFLDKFLKEQKRMEKKVLYIKHNKEKYGKIPIWVGTEFLSFGTVSHLYENMKTGDKKKIARDYFGLSYEILESWLRSISNVRNRCAHHSRIYNTYFIFNMKKDHIMVSNNINNKSLFAVLIALKSLLLNPNQWDRVCSDLSSLVKENETIIELSRMGFPQNWKEILES
jgi:abortive infection bacteriophage resistance protein